ncbi:hypothetical protein P3T36_005278 [Kitasatospora sp. MAP12-15]|uniref:hypothetical protein n=1 Tax=unclassified Kitasatospora TaxID=2633591 RepID=UPI002473D141|nr:hypothetical protein [Kitasatospora sp. MAP12-44]MDH6113559.1 hypothetical protein [Kitasatospora sp. MAP12-44]
MPRMLNVSDEVRAEIGDDEADRLLGGAHAPDSYDCTSCRTPGDSINEPTSTVLFVGEETAVLAFAHARCIPSQVVAVSEEQLLGAVRSISQTQGSGLPAQAYPVDPAYQAYPVDRAYPADPMAMPAPPAAQLYTPAAPAPVAPAPAAPEPSAEPVTGPAPGEPAILGITCGLVLCGDTGHAALVVEPTGPVGRPGSLVGADEFLSLLTEHGFAPIHDVEQPPAVLPGWSVLMAMGRLHAILQPSAAGTSAAWWQAHQPLLVTEPWRAAASRYARVIMYAAPAGTIGRQPREDLLRTALDRAAAQGLLVAAALPLAGT